MNRRSTKPVSPPAPSVTIAAEPFRISSRSAALALRHDEREIASCDGATVRVNDARSGQLLRSAAIQGLHASPGDVLLAFSVDGALLFVGAAPGGGEHIAPVLVLDADTLTVLRAIEPEFDATAIVPHPSDPSLLLVAGARLAMYDARTARIIAELAASGAGRPAQRALCSPSGRWLATKTDSSVELWSVATLERTKTYPLATWSAAIAFSSDSERLFVCTQGRLVTLSVASDERPFERSLAQNVTASVDGPTALFDLDGDEMLLCLGADLRVFDARTLQLRRSAKDRCHIGDRVLSRDRKALFANNAEGAIERVALDTLDVLRPAIATEVHALAWLDDETVIAAHGEAIAKATLATATMAPVRAFDERFTTAAASANGRFAAVAMTHSSEPTEVIACETGRVEQRLAGFEGEVLAVSDDRRFVAEMRGTRLILWRDGVEARVGTRAGNVKRAAFVGARTLCWISAGGVFFADVERAAETRFVKVSGCAALGTNGRGLAIVATAASLRVFDASGGESFAIASKGARFTSAAITEDGAMVAGGTGDGRLTVARRDSGAASVRPLRSSAIVAVAFSRDGARLAVATQEPELFVYDVASLRR